MSDCSNRRMFLRAAAASGALAGAADLGFLSKLPPAGAAEAGAVRLRTEIGPLVTLLETAPRDRLLEEVAAKIRQGTTYQDLLDALLLAGVRNVQPRPSVGFKFHSVLVVNSVHLAAQASPESDRWLPIFWALDYFKDAQAQDVREGDWTMRPVDERAVPPAAEAERALVQAMEQWNEASADAAAAGLVRSAKLDLVYEPFYRLGARDFRSIGHKAIFVANSRRTLDFLGPDDAEPVVRSLAYALLMHEGDSPAKRDDPADRPWRQNQERAAKIRSGWENGDGSDEATVEMLATLRQGDDQAASAKVVEFLNRGVAPQSIWDALFCGAAELLARQPGIVALHAVTTTNALHAAYRATASELTRRLLLLQNAAFLPLFLQAMRGRGIVGQVQIDKLEPLRSSGAGAEAVDEILADIGRQPMSAARRTLGYLQTGGDPQTFITAGRRLILMKARESHDYKFSSAALEDFEHVSPGWRDRYLAASVFRLLGPENRDSDLVRRIRKVLVG